MYKHMCRAVIYRPQVLSNSAHVLPVVYTRLFYCKFQFPISKSSFKAPKEFSVLLELGHCPLESTKPGKNYFKTVFRLYLNP